MHMRDMESVFVHEFDVINDALRKSSLLLSPEREFR